MSEIVKRGDNAVSVGFMDGESFNLANRVATALSSSSLVPKEYQGKEGLPNCMIALNIAARINADPLMVMQNLYIVHGRPSWSSQFLIATFNTCGRFSNLRYEFFGEKGSDNYGCKAWAIEKETKERIEGTEVTIAMAKKEGWYSKSGSKWQSIPEQMLRYRAAAWFIRAYAPELAMGMQTEDEIIDIAEDESGTYVANTTLIDFEPDNKDKEAQPEEVPEEQAAPAPEWMKQGQEAAK